MWLFFSSFCVGLFPLWQGRKTAVHTIKSMFLDLTGKKHVSALHGQSQSPPPEKEGSESGNDGALTTEVVEGKEKK